MKNFMIAGSVIAFIALSSFTIYKAGTKVNVDVKKSTIEWVGKKITGQHNGTIALKSGYFESTNGMITGGEFVIDMNSIVNLDLEDEESNAKLVGHLKSADWFGVEEHPTATLKIKEIKATFAETGNSIITADLTIKGKTNPIEFGANIMNFGETVSADAKLTIDRSQYDVRYGSKSFFDDLGDKVIDDDMVLTIKIESVKK